MTDRPHLAPFKSDRVLTLEPAPNGGWIVRVRADDPCLQAPLVGAFSNACDMLAALTDALLPEGEA